MTASRDQPAPSRGPNPGRTRPASGLPVDEGDLEGVHVRAVHVGAELDGAAAVVEGGAIHGEERVALPTGEQFGGARIGPDGADSLVRDTHMEAGPSQVFVE